MSQPASYFKNRRQELKAAGRCIDCAVSKTVKGYSRCYGCREKQKKYNVYRYGSRVVPRPSTPEELYQAVKHERELVSWAWRNPA